MIIDAIVRKNTAKKTISGQQHLPQGREQHINSYSVFRIPNSNRVREYFYSFQNKFSFSLSEQELLVA
jgi:hypothetical protein